MIQTAQSPQKGTAMNVPPAIPPLEDVMDLIKKFSNFCLERLPCEYYEFGELVNDGVLAYYKQVEKFDPMRGAKFITIFWYRLKSLYSNRLSYAYRRRNKEIVTCRIIEGCPESDENDSKANPTNPEDFRLAEDPESVNLEELLYCKVSPDAEKILRLSLTEGKITKQNLFARVGLSAQQGRAVLREIQVAMSPMASRMVG